MHCKELPLSPQSSISVAINERVENAFLSFKQAVQMTRPDDNYCYSTETVPEPHMFVPVPSCIIIILKFLLEKEVCFLNLVSAAGFQNRSCLGLVTRWIVFRDRNVGIRFCICSLIAIISVFESDSNS